jgi:hypothetical protein
MASMKKKILAALAILTVGSIAAQNRDFVGYVNTLQGTDSNFG